jgi:putative oxidoreductase
MNRFSAETYSLLRIMAGLMYLFHGAQKLFGFPLPSPDAPAFIVYGAGSIEFFGGILIAVGLFTNWVAFLCAGEMAAAYWIAHGTQAFFPLVNKGELAALYCFVFLYISANGPGIWSVDGIRR